MAFITRYSFLLFYFIFVFGIVFITAQIGLTIFSNAPAGYTLPTNPADLLNPITLISTFITLMSISTDFAWLGTFIILPLTLVFLVIIIEIIRNG